MGVRCRGRGRCCRRHRAAVAGAPVGEHDRACDDAEDGRHDGCGDGRAAHRTILEALRDAVGNPCTARYVDPVRVGSLPRGSSTLGRADGTPPPRHRAVRARARRARCRPAPHPLARRHVRHRRPVHAERPRRDQHPQRPSAGRDDDARTEPLERHAHRPGDADGDRAAHRAPGRRPPASTATSSRSRQACRAASSCRTGR